MHQLVNCNYAPRSSACSRCVLHRSAEPKLEALFAHCGNPDASSNSSCAQDVLKLHSCRSTYGLPHGVSALMLMLVHC